jgi:SAM-dependent methyltransferase
MTDDYGVTPNIHEGQIYDALNRDLSDLPFYEQRCREAGGPILELCCGTGRLTLPLLRAGFDITGLDFTESMLERARAKAAAESISASFVSGDMRDFSLERRFSLIFLPFNSLQNTYTIDDVERVLGCVRQHLLPGGTFIFDIFNPDFERLVKKEGGPVECHRGFLDDGREVVVTEECRYDAAGQVNRVTWYHHIEDETFIGTLDMRCYFPLEMLALLRLSGWQVIERFGDFSGAPLASDSPKQIFVCRPAGE